MYHFFVREEQVSGETAVITGPDVNHIKNVLRMKPGEKILLNTGGDWDYLCEIREIGKEEVTLSVVSENRNVSELPSKITLYQGLPKSDKMEWIIQKAVELGVYRIVPVLTKRVIVKWDERKSAEKTRRSSGIAEAAAKQSGRNIVPEVTEPFSWDRALQDAAGNEVRLIPYELADDMEETRKIISSLKPGQSVAVFIGPEGGFEETEIREAEAAGFQPVTLGKRILRTETAGLVMLSLLMAELEGKTDSNKDDSNKDDSNKDGQ